MSWIRYSQFNFKSGGNDGDGGGILVPNTAASTKKLVYKKMPQNEEVWAKYLSAAGNNFDPHKKVSC